MKRKKDDEMVQTAVRLPQSLRDRLSSAGGEGGLGEEIRHRLEASFDAEKVPATAKTREVLDAISFFDQEMFHHFGSWSKEPFAFAAMKACVDLLLTYYRPDGEAKAPPATDSKAALLYGPDSSPEDIGRLLVRDWIRRVPARADEEKRK
jgi:hypothetical protein